ncbi:FecR domain-containing protein [cf. Phormidesmis sp. LEGE 11477]|uniref:FecR family protein n=1 Tax=cf. Phormidesmis sp. LEGE 11477 TaxID=1828680 RepID=UPI001882CE25|nr:FecR family protein [cf. Phormidesmis sp. LEGE 11477]MBE9064897.1 FecR domain-containing protein [cf. Phormidesmis sp. LEGE 11477]
MFKVRPTLLFMALLGLMICLLPAYGQLSRVEGPRWLSVTQINGDVTIVPFGKNVRRAQMGDRLSQVGDQVITGQNSSAQLTVDQGIASISVAERTQLQVRTLSITRSGGYITELLALRGQARLRVRPFTSPDSRLEIYTPAGVSGVRGTDFGITVQPDGKTGVATLEGSVTLSAQNQTVLVGTEQQSTASPGEPPTPPEPLRDDPSLSISALKPISDGSVQVSGSTDPVNLLEVAEARRVLDEGGQFDLTVALPRDRRVRIQVTTPLGTQQAYELAVP